MLQALQVSRFMEAVRQGGSDAVFECLADMVRSAIGTRLLTASVYDMDVRQSRRIYTDNPQAYPVGGLKPVPDGPWTDAVLLRQEVFSSLAIEEIAKVFFDWELIRSLGCESNANIPVVVEGRVIGTLNLLDVAGTYTPEKLATVPALMPYATIAFLLMAPLPQSPDGA